MKFDLSHDELASNLARHLLNEGRMVWEDIPAGRRHSVRPDVYTIEKSFANPNPISYEVKVSLADFRSDVTSAKWKAYLEFSYGVVFAVPKGLITKKDVPNNCGLITFNGEFWNTVKRPTLHPAELDDDLLLKLLISGKERQSKPFEPVPRPFDEERHYDALRKKFGEDIRQKLHFIGKFPQMMEELTEMRSCLSRLFGEELPKDIFNTWRFDYVVSKAIEELEIKAKEETRKAAIAKELQELSEVMDRRMNIIINRYTA